MARIRTIKPAFFMSSTVADVSYGARILFIGIWTLADRDGRMVWNQREVKAQVFPHDDPAAPVAEFAAELVEQDHVRFYAREAAVFLWIPNFLKHQRPHPKEPASVIPAWSDTDPRGWLPWKKTASRVLPGSIPSSPVGREGKGMDKGKGREYHAETADEQGVSESPQTGGRLDVWFEELWSLYPEHRRRRSRIVVEAFIAALEGHADAPWMRWDRMRANLLTQKAGGQWAKDDMVPSLENWLTKGAWEEKHKPADAPAENPNDPRVQMDAWLKRKQAEKGASA